MRPELSVEENIKKRWPRLTKSQQRVGRLILDSPQRLALTSAGTLARELGTATSTIVRTATALGFAGYVELQQALQREIFSQSSLMERFSATDGSDLRTAEDAMRHTLMIEVDALEQTVTSQSFDAFDKVVELLLESRYVFLTGLGVSHASAHVFAVGLRQLGIDARLVGGATTDIAEEMHGAGAHDTLIAIAMAKYPRRIIHSLEYAEARGINRIAITDQGLSPLARNADEVLYARPSKPHYFQSVMPSVLVVNSLLTTVAIRGGERARNSLAQMDEEWEASGSFVRNEKE